jgi:hypothetical protein
MKPVYDDPATLAGVEAGNSSRAADDDPTLIEIETGVVISG